MLNRHRLRRGRIHDSDLGLLYAGQSRQTVAYLGRCVGALVRGPRRRDLGLRPFLPRMGLYDLVTGKSSFVQHITRRENPITYWLVVATWIVLSVLWITNPR